MIGRKSGLRSHPSYIGVRLDFVRSCSEVLGLNVDHVLSAPDVSRNFVSDSARVILPIEGHPHTPHAIRRWGLLY